MKKALITGASRGIGKAIALKLSKKGFFTIMVARHFDFTEPKNAKFIKLDLLKENSTKILFSLIKAQDVDVIIHNLGGVLPNDIHPIDSKVLLESVYFNLGVATDINYICLQQWGDSQNNSNNKLKKKMIIFLSSDSSLNGKASPAYVASKSALNAYMKSSARFYAKKNIIFFSILLGIVYSKNGYWHTKKIKEPKKFRLKKKESIFGDFMRPKDVANLAYSLIMSKNKFINGGEFCVNGGE